MGGEPRSKAKAKKERADTEKLRFLGPNVWMEDTEGVSPGPTGRSSASLEALVQWARTRNDGWLRLVPDCEGQVHWKWRFTSGRWAGHYVYFLQTVYQTAEEAFAGLARKLDSVDVGGLRPSKDDYR